MNKFKSFGEFLLAVKKASDPTRAGNYFIPINANRFGAFNKGKDGHMTQINKLEKRILRIIADHSIYFYRDLENAFKKCKSFDILIEAIEAGPALNISLEIAIMSSPINIKRTEREKENT